MQHRLNAFRATAAVMLTAAFAGPLAAQAAGIDQRDVLIKGPGAGATVYYLANDGKRYVFPNEKMYRSWFSDFSGVLTVTGDDLAAYTIGGNVNYRPGIRMVKITSDPKVYAVDKGGVLRWITTEALAVSLYGTDWNTKIDDMPDAFFFSYFLGAPITSTADYQPLAAAQSSVTINDDKSISASASPRRSDTLPDVTGAVTGASITSFSIPAISGAIGYINENSRTVMVTVPYGTSRTALVANVGHTGVSVSPASGTSHDFTNPVTYTVTASDGTTRAYTVTVSIAPRSSVKSITHFSFVNLSGTDGDIDDTAKTIAVTVPYGTSVTSLTPTITFTGTAMTPASGVARNFTNPQTYKVTAEDITTRIYTVTVTVAPPAYVKTITSFSFPNLSSDGSINESAHTIAVTVPYGTSVSSLAPTVEFEGASVSPSSGSSRSFTNPVTYTVTARDGTKQAYVVTVTVSPYRSTKRITAFSFPAYSGATGSIDQTAHTVAVTVPYGTSRSSLTPEIVIDGASVSPASGVARSFTSPVTYTVTAEDGSTQAYKVTVTVAPYSSAKAITSFKFFNLSGATGAIDESARAIAVTVPHGTDVTSLVPTVTFDGASLSPASGVAKNFTSPVTYRVTAQDGTTRSYVVTVTVAP